MNKFLFILVCAVSVPCLAFSQSSLRPRVALSYLNLPKNSSIASNAYAPNFLIYNSKNRFINPALSIHPSEYNVFQLDFNTSSVGSGWLNQISNNISNGSFSASLKSKHAVYVGFEYLNHFRFDLINEDLVNLGSNKAYDFNFSLGYSYKISENVAVGTNISYLNSSIISIGRVSPIFFDKSTINKLIFDLGVNVERKIGSKSKIYSGISFLNIGSSIRSGTLANNQSFLPTKSNLYVAIVTNINQRNRFSFTLQTTKSLVSNTQNSLILVNDNMVFNEPLNVLEVWQQSFNDYKSLNDYLLSSTNSLSMEYLYYSYLRFALGVVYQKSIFFETTTATFGVGVSFKNTSINLSLENPIINTSSSLYPNTNTISININYLWSKNKKNKHLLCPY